MIEIENRFDFIKKLLSHLIRFQLIQFVHTNNDSIFFGHKIHKGAVSIYNFWKATNGHLRFRKSNGKSSGVPVVVLRTIIIRSQPNSDRAYPSVV